MAITFTSRGALTNDGETASLTSISTVSGRLYVVAAIGAWFTNWTNTNAYTDLTVTATGVTVTEAIQSTTPNDYRANRPMTALSWFVGSGASVNVTCTLGGKSGSPIYPITGICLFEVTGASSVSRTGTRTVDVNSGGLTGPYTVSASITGTEIAGNNTLSLIAITGEDGIPTITPNGGESQLATGTRTNAAASGLSWDDGSNVTWQVQAGPSLTSAWASSQNEYWNSIVLLEVVGDVSGGGVSGQTIEIPPGVVYLDGGGVLVNGSSSPAVTRLIDVGVSQVAPMYVGLTPVSAVYIGLTKVFG